MRGVRGPLCLEDCPTGELVNFGHGRLRREKVDPEIFLSFCNPRVQTIKSWAFFPLVDGELARGLHSPALPVRHFARPVECVILSLIFFPPEERYF